MSTRSGRADAAEARETISAPTDTVMSASYIAAAPARRLRITDVVPAARHKLATACTPQPTTTPGLWAGRSPNPRPARPQWPQLPRPRHATPRHGKPPEQADRKRWAS
jgi:hypothetical protein